MERDHFDSNLSFINVPFNVSSTSGDVMLLWPDLRYLHCKLTILFYVNANVYYLQGKTQQSAA